MWAKGRIEKLKEQLRNDRVTAIMINVDVLSPEQQVLFFSHYLFHYISQSFFSNISKISSYCLNQTIIF